MTWELSFEKLISTIRVKELKILKSIALLNATAAFSWTVAPFLVNKNELIHLKFSINIFLKRFLQLRLLFMYFQMRIMF